MPVNQHIANLADTPLQTKLVQLADSLGAALGSPSLATREALLSEVARTLGHFYRNLEKPVFTPRETLPETAPDLTEYNTLFTDTSSDLSILFTQLENAEDFVLQNFNYIAAEGSRLNKLLRELGSRYTDLALYTNTISSNFIYWKDSFVNTAKLDLGSNLLNKPLCEVNQVEGIVTLPINRNAESRVIPTKTTILNDSSNGVLGNNQQLGLVDRHTDLATILDLNPDTWMEYERVVRTDDQVPLVMDLLLMLADPRVINFIRINPNNFGLQVPLTISEISTSVNGKDYISVKDEIPIAGFLAEDEDNIFTLAPSTSKFAGQGLYTFTARKAKYVRITLVSDTPYLINTSSGQKTRYAIGIRDIDIRAFNYLTDGEIVSTQIVPSDEVKKVILEASQNPVGKSDLVSITHQISPDDGITWYDIQPKGLSGTDAPEVLDFNGVTANTVTTTNPVFSLKWKAILSRDTDAFSGGLIQQKIARAAEVHSIGATLPGKFKLTQTPIEGSVRISDPAFGARGFEDVTYLAGIGSGQTLTIKLPWKRIEKDLAKTTHATGYGVLGETDPEIVEINGEVCSRVSDISGYSAGDRVYELNYTTGELQAIPEKDAEVRIRFTRERAHPLADAGKHFITTKFTLTPDPNLIDIYVVGEATQTSEVLPKGVTEIQLQNQSVVSGTISFDDGSTAATTDLDNGVVTLSTPTSRNTDRSVSYSYTPKRKLSTSEWSFDTDSAGNRVINIQNDSFDTVLVTDEPLEQSVRRLELTNQGVVRGSIKFALPSGVTAGSASDPFRREIQYIDGATEFLHLQKTQEVIETPTGPVSNIYTITLSQPASGDKISFLKTPKYFDLNPVGGTPAGDNEWKKAADSLSIQWYYALTLPSDLGSVHYYYSDPTHSSTGEYSVDYQRGIIAVPSGLSNDYLVDYEYTNYEIDYYIARDVPTENFTVDATRNSVSFTDTEVIRRGKFKSASRTYHITYNYIEESRTDAEELEPYFTPVLRDYSLKILTKNRMQLI